MINSADIVENALRNGRNTALGQFTMFDAVTEQSICEDNFLPEADFPLSDKLLFEKELTGIYFSGHPLDKFRRKFETAQCVPISEITEERYKDGQNVRVGVMISKITRKKTSKGTVMATAEVEDFVSFCEAVAFPNILERFQGEFYVGNIAVIDAEVSFDYNDNLNLIVKNITSAEKFSVPAAKTVYIRIKTENELAKVKSLAEKYRGSSHLAVFVEEKNMVYSAKNGQNVHICTSFLSDAEKIFGKDNVKVK